MIYAIVENGIVINTIVWDGQSPWTPPEGSEAIAVPDDVSVGPGYRYEDGTFSAPPTPPVIPPTQEEIVASNTAIRNKLLSAAVLAIAPLQDAVDLGEATAEETAFLKAWKQFRVVVNRIDLTQESPAWPNPPQPGYGAALSPPVSDS